MIQFTALRATRLFETDQDSFDTRGAPISQSRNPWHRKNSFAATRRKHRRDRHPQPRRHKPREQKQHDRLPAHPPQLPRIAQVRHREDQREQNNRHRDEPQTPQKQIPHKLRQLRRETRPPTRPHPRRSSPRPLCAPHTAPHRPLRATSTPPPSTAHSPRTRPLAPSTIPIRIFQCSASRACSMRPFLSGNAPMVATLPHPLPESPDRTERDAPQ